MKNNRRNRTPLPSAHLPHLEDGHLHFRLCHLCLHLNEADHELTQCSECHHVFKDEILTQFFDNNDLEAFTDAHPDDVASEDEETDEKDAATAVRDLNGLSVRF